MSSEDLSALFYIFGIFLISSPTIWQICRVNKQNKHCSEEDKQTIWLDEKPLHEQSLFWISLLTPIFAFIFFAIPYLYEYKFSFNSISNLKTFLNLLKEPFWVLASTVPVVALIASAHRSIQTNEQIKKTDIQILENQKKNNLDFYFKHREETIKIWKSKLTPILKEYCTENNIEDSSFDIKPSVYALFYTGNNHSGFKDCSEEDLKRFEDSFNTLRQNVEDSINEMHSMSIDGIDIGKLNNAYQILSMSIISNIKKIYVNSQDLVIGMELTLVASGRKSMHIQLESLENLYKLYCKSCKAIYSEVRSHYDFEEENIAWLLGLSDFEKIKMLGDDFKRELTVQISSLFHNY